MVRRECIKQVGSGEMQGFTKPHGNILQVWTGQGRGIITAGMLKGDTVQLRF